MHVSLFNDLPTATSEPGLDLRSSSGTFRFARELLLSFDVRIIWFTLGSLQTYVAPLRLGLDVYRILVVRGGFCLRGSLDLEALGDVWGHLRGYFVSTE